MTTHGSKRWTNRLLVLALASAALVSPVLAQAPVWTEDTKLISGDSAPDDLFGRAIAASGDTVVVGAPGRDAGANGDGAAYVFVRSGASWALQQKLVASDVGAFYGMSVAIEGDTIAVGDNFNNGQRGAVYVYARSGTTWTQQAKLDSGQTQFGSQFFGGYIALSGDTLLVSATADTEGGVTGAGAVYVFTRSGGTWTLQQTLHAPALIANQSFGLGLALDGDRAAIGLVDHFSSGRTVYLYERTAGTFSWTYVIPNPTGDAFYGYSLDLEGDRLLVSSGGDDQVAADAGAAYVFELNVSNWIQTAKLLPEAAAGDGYSVVALEGDLIVLGGPGSDLAAAGAGAAQVFVREDSVTWSKLATLTASDGIADATFGLVAIAGGSVLVGAPVTYRAPPPPTDCGGRGQPACPPPPTPPSGSAYEFVIGSVDVEPPALDIPFDHMNVEASSSAGGVPTFSFSAPDDVDGTVTAVCVPASGSVFPFGATLVTCTATDTAGNAATDSFTIHVADTTDPSAVCTDVVTECTGELTSVTTSCTATDTVDPDPFTSSTAQASYPVSSNQYHCSATDDSGNIDVDVCSVHVVDTVPPTCVAPPTLYTACTEAGGTSPGAFAIQEHLGFFQAADACDMAGVSIGYSNIDLFPSGCQTGATSSITVTVRDEGNNRTSCSSDVVVYDNRAPLVTVPDPITLECDVTGGVSGSDANIAAWLSDATASDVCHDEALTNNAPAFFAVGSELVSFTGIDSCGNDSTRNSSVSVVDTTAPAATCQNAVFECTGALTPVTTSCGASDICDGTVAVISDADPSYALGQHAFACHAQDDSGNGGSASCQVAVIDTQAPVIQPIVTVLAPVPVGTSVTASAAFSDVCGTHIGTWTFGDGASSAATMSAGSASGSHIYTMPGVYTLTLTLGDGSGNNSTATYQYVVVFDPNGPNVSGSGSVLSPPGAYTPDPSISGKASFGFLARYRNGAFVPDGHTHFRFRAADFVFQSDAYEWLVVAGPHAKYKGTGSVNGVAGYRFMLTATDGERPGGGGLDRLHLKVWAASGGVIYDNEPGVADDASATQAIDSGHIVIRP
jgi:hypothetical protein